MLVAIFVACFVTTIWVYSVIIEFSQYDLNVQFNCCHFDVQFSHCHFDVQFSHCHFDVQFNQCHFMYISGIVILSYLSKYFHIFLLLTKETYSHYILHNAMYTTTSIQTHFDMKLQKWLTPKHNTLHPILGQHQIKGSI